MGDMGEIFKEMKEKSKERRASNREKIPKLLNGTGIPF